MSHDTPPSQYTPESMLAPMSAHAFQQETGVSDDTLARLETYAQLLQKWQPKINLVGPDTLPHVWSRHMLDCAQLAAFVPVQSRVVDLGSGAGFPGLVLAILRADKPNVKMGTKNVCGDMYLVESDQRKCAFLREVRRATETDVTILNDRIETLAPLGADVIISRALANLDRLLAFADIHRLSTGKCVFMKGKRWQGELTQAQKHWTMKVQEHMSRTNGEARILELSEIVKR